MHLTTFKAKPTCKIAWTKTLIKKAQERFHEKAKEDAQTKQIPLADLLKNLSPAEFSEDGLQIQRALRDEWD